MNPATAVAWLASAFLSASLFSHTVTLRLTLLCLGAVLAVIAVRGRGSEIKVLPPIWLPFAAWAAWATLSLAWSVEPARTLKELQNEVAYSAIALWICFVGAQAQGAARIFLPAVAAAVTAAIAVGLWEFSRGWGRYLVGLHGGPGDHSSALLTLTPCVAMTAWYGSRAGWQPRLRWLVWALGALFLVGAYFTLNRSIWLGFAAQFALLALLLLSRARTWSARKKSLTVSLTAAILAAMTIAFLVSQAKREDAGGKPLEHDYRLALWPAIIDQIEEQPLTGHGFGRGLLRGPLQKEFRNLDGNLWHAHNIFLEALLQVGISGLALLLVLLAALFREAWRLARTDDNRAAACGMALAAVVAGMLVRNMTDTLLVRQNALLYWGVVGVLLGLAAKARTPAN